MEEAMQPNTDWTEDLPCIMTSETAESKGDCQIHKQVRQASVRLGLNVVHPALGREDGLDNLKITVIAI